MSKTFEVVKIYKTLDSKDHPNRNRARFAALVEEEFAKFITNIPTVYDFVCLQDLTPLGVATKFHFINGVPAVRQVTTFEIKDDSVLTRFDCEYLKPVEPTSLTPEQRQAAHEASLRTEPQPPEYPALKTNEKGEIVP